MGRSGAGSRGREPGPGAGVGAGAGVGEGAGARDWDWGRDCHRGWGARPGEYRMHSNRAGGGRRGAAMRAPVRRPQSVRTRDAIFRKMINQNQTGTNEMATTETKYQTDFHSAEKYQHLTKF